MDVAHRAGPESPLPVALGVVEPVVGPILLGVAEIGELPRLKIEQRKILS
jgi:hypothetical protein